MKAGSVSGGFDNVDGPGTEFGEGITQVGAVVDAVSEEVAQPRKQLMDGLDDKRNDPPAAVRPAGLPIVVAPLPSRIPRL